MSLPWHQHSLTFVQRYANKFTRAMTPYLSMPAVRLLHLRHLFVHNILGRPLFPTWIHLDNMQSRCALVWNKTIRKTGPRTTRLIPWRTPGRIYMHRFQVPWCNIPLRISLSNKDDTWRRLLPCRERTKASFYFILFKHTVLLWQSDKKHLL